MALATRCPNCDVVFRVVADQLKLRGGLVRCGSCRHVFDAIGSLSYVDGSTVAEPPPAPKLKGAPLTLRITPREPARIEHAASASRINVAAVDASEGVPTLMASGSDDARATASAPSEETDAERMARRERRRQRALQKEKSKDRPKDKPRRREQVEILASDEINEPLSESEPEFLRSERSPRGFSVVFTVGSLLLALALLVQTAILFRTDLITRWPAMRPTLVSLCDAFGCTVGWPTRAELLAVVGTELQAIPGTDLLELTAVIRNRAAFRVALPAIEVTLSDTQNRTLARKVFAPVDYLTSMAEPSNRLAEGLAAGSDYTVRITFEARALAAAGFVVYPFYL